MESIQVAQTTWVAATDAALRSAKLAEDKEQTAQIKLSAHRVQVRKLKDNLYATQEELSVQLVQSTLRKEADAKLADEVARSAVLKAQIRKLREGIALSEEIAKNAKLTAELDDLRAALKPSSDVSPSFVNPFPNQPDTCESYEANAELWQRESQLVWAAKRPRISEDYNRMTDTQLRDTLDRDERKIADDRMDGSRTTHPHTRTEARRTWPQVAHLRPHTVPHLSNESAIAYNLGSNSPVYYIAHLRSTEIRNILNRRRTHEADKQRERKRRRPDDEPERYHYPPRETSDRRSSGSNKKSSSSSRHDDRQRSVSDAPQEAPHTPFISDMSYTIPHDHPEYDLLLQLRRHYKHSNGNPNDAWRTKEECFLHDLTTGEKLRSTEFQMMSTRDVLRRNTQRYGRDEAKYKPLMYYQNKRDLLQWNLQRKCTAIKSWDRIQHQHMAPPPPRSSEHREPPPPDDIQNVDDDSDSASDDARSETTSARSQSISKDSSGQYSN
jgi:hypothetical protein